MKNRNKILIFAAILLLSLACRKNEELIDVVVFPQKTQNYIDLEVPCEGSISSNTVIGDSNNFNISKIEVDELRALNPDEEEDYENGEGYNGDLRIKCSGSDSSFVSIYFSKLLANSFTFNIGHTNYKDYTLIVYNSNFDAFFEPSDGGGRAYVEVNNDSVVISICNMPMHSSYSNGGFLEIYRTDTISINITLDKHLIYNKIDYTYYSY